MIYSSRGKSYTGCNTVKELYNYLRKNIKYSNFTKLKSAEEVVSDKSGSCHDQVMLELNELRAMGIKAKALFIIEYNHDQGGMTHSFAYFNDNKKVVWLENAWSDYKGIHEFDSLQQIKSSITDMHKRGVFGNIKKYPNIEFFNFGKHTPGETLQEFVDKIVD